jgi:hypothetical protein
MAAGTKIKVSGNRVSYAGSGISGGLTSGLLSVFTDVSGATPAAGSLMRPKVNNIIGSNEPLYAITGGTYSGEYFINRNDPVGETFYSNWNALGGRFSLDDFHSYIHWPTDQRLAIDVNNGSGFIYGFAIKIGSTPIIDLSAFSPGPYSTGLDYYGNLPGTAGAYSPGTINTGWGLIIGVAYDPSNPPRGSITFDVDVRDYHTNDTILATTSVRVGGSSSGFPFSDNIIVDIDYWRCANISVFIT